jgi:hypothetical protein
MSYVAESLFPRIVKMAGNSKALLARYVQSLIEARRLRREHERDFHRNLKAYCRVNNLSPICGDDWKTAACHNPDDNLSLINTKGNVS